MNRACWSAAALGIAQFFVTLYAHIEPKYLGILLTLILLVIQLVFMLTALIVGITKWRKSTRLWLAPAVVCMAFILSSQLTPWIGRHLSDWRFERHLAEYTRVVEGLENGSISCTSPCVAKFEAIETRMPAHVRDAWGARCDDGGVIVVFLADTNVPLLHEGYFFKNSTSHSDCSKGSVTPEMNWPGIRYTRHITGEWYHFSDQPGL